ncbi:MAG: hypothetical protein ACE5GI_02270 [Candidatus Aminicenantales bacterium]
MIKFMAVFYPLGLAVCLIIFFLHQKILNHKKRFIGKIKGQWSTIFSPYFPINWLRWLAAAAYLVWSVLWALKAPEAKGPHGNFMLLALLLSFSPRAKVYYGTQGIIFKMRAISWKQIREKKVVGEGQRRLLLIKLGPSISPSQKTIKILLPAKVEEIINQEP